MIAPHPTLANRAPRAHHQRAHCGTMPRYEGINTSSMTGAAHNLSGGVP